MEKLYVGVDVGSSGAIVMINDKKQIMRTMVMPKNGKEFDLQTICRLLADFSQMEIHVVVEDVHAIQGNIGGTSNFNFGRAKMIFEMGLMAFGISHTLVQPKIWQKDVWEGVTKTMKPTKRKLKDGSFAKKVDTKLTSLTAVQRLFPMVDLRDPDRKTDRAKKPHDGVVDALLMAEHCRRKFR